VLTDGVAKLDPPGFEVAVEAMFPPPGLEANQGDR